MIQLGVDPAKYARAAQRYGFRAAPPEVLRPRTSDASRVLGWLTAAVLFFGLLAIM